MRILDFMVEKLGIENSLKKNDIILQCANYKDIISTAKKGDFIYTGTPAGVGPLKVGDHLEAYIEDKKLLDCKIS